MLSCIEEKGKSNMAENPRPRRSEDIQQCIQQTKDSTLHPENRKLHDIRLFFKKFGPLIVKTDKIKKKAAPASSRNSEKYHANGTMGQE